MLDIHPAHHAASNWRDFFIHIATIVIGLCIAVGLEQTVEAIHHHHQLHDLQEQMHQVLESDAQNDTLDVQLLSDRRALLSGLRARIDTRPGQPPPPQSASHITGLLRIPSIAPYEAAKENGTVALLASDDIRLYNRLALQRDFLLDDVTDWKESNRALDSFEQRFADFHGNRIYSDFRPGLDPSKLSPANLDEYRTLIAATITDIDLLSARIQFFDRECRAVLAGTRDENFLLIKPRTP
jgi:hypothetical protein